MKLVLIALALLLVGCSTLQNTPQQDYVYDMARPCEANGVTIAYVSPDGKDWRGQWFGGAHTWPEFQQCFSQQMKAHPYKEWLKATGR